MRAEISHALTLHTEVLSPVEAYTREFVGVHALSIGRAPDCALQLDAHVVSRRHATLRCAHGTLEVSDHSANGTRANGVWLRGATRSFLHAVTLQCGPFVVRVSVSTPSSVGASMREVPDGLRTQIRAELAAALVGLPREQVARRQRRAEDALVRLAVRHAHALPRGPAQSAFFAELRREFASRIAGRTS